MGRLAIASALILGLVGATCSVLGEELPKYPLHPNEGCVPGQVTSTSCPAKMACWLDPNYPNGGRCDVNTEWLLKVGKLPFNPDSEWDDGFSREDLVDHQYARIQIQAWFLLLLAMSLALFHTCILIITELKRNKALKWNATAYSLFLLAAGSCGYIAIELLYITGYWEIDSQETFYRARTLVYIWGLNPFFVPIDYEISVTWIDLYDRTRKMSKRSSRATKALRYALRGLALVQMSLFYYFMSSGDSLALLITGSIPSVFGFPFVLGGGMTILRVLCPDKNDVSNPNYKVAQAIRRAVKHALVCKVLDASVLILGSIVQHHPVLAYWYGPLNALYWTVHIVRQWGWLQYLIYGSRKHLAKYANDASSAYFGFSTIGLNKTLTTASSKVSTMSSAMSTRSSFASGHDDKD